MLTKREKFLSIVVIILTLLSLIPFPAGADFSSLAVLNEISGKVARPGDLVEFSFTVEKGYNTSESTSVTFYIEKVPENWTAGVYADGSQVSQITLPEKADEKELTFKVRVPENAKDGGYTVKIGLKPYGENIRNYDKIYREFTVTIDRAAMPNLEIYSDIPGKKTHPGIPVSFGAFVENKYDSRANFRIFLVSKPEEWGVDLLSTDGARITRLGVPGDGSQEFKILVNPPLNATKGDYEILVAACPEKGNQSVFLPISVSINPELSRDEDLSAYVELNSNIMGFDIRPEKTAEFAVSLKNRYDQPLKLKLEVLSLPEGWKAEFLTEEDKEGRLASLMLPAGEEQEFTVKVKPSQNATSGLYPVIIAAVSGDKKVTRQLEVGINNDIENEELLKVDSNPSELTLNPGGSSEVRVNIENRGDEDLEDVTLEINEANGISAQIQGFGTIDELEAGESRSVSVEITANANAGSGVKEIFIRAKSDDLVSSEKSIKVNVEKSSSSGLLGIAMLGFAVLVLVFVVRKFGRR
ncbi:MAG: NEW3 domain-containing protein [Methanosarcina sp.]